jgi:hypothetical protein
MKNEIVLYQSNELSRRIDVRVEAETVWLNRHQLAVLFNRDVKTIGKHLKNVFSEGELDRNSTVANFATVQNEGGRTVERMVEYYNLDVIISVGYRVKSKQGIFFDGQIFDAYKFVSDLFRTAEKSIIIADNYIDDTVLVHLTKLKKGVRIKIITKSVSDQFRLDIKKFESQYSPIEVKVLKNIHDRFIIIDDEVLYFLGASLKDLGKKLFGFTKMEHFTPAFLHFVRV